MTACHKIVVEAGGHTPPPVENRVFGQKNLGTPTVLTWYWCKTHRQPADVCQEVSDGATDIGRMIDTIDKIRGRPIRHDAPRNALGQRLVTCPSCGCWMHPQHGAACPLCRQGIKI